ncbi:hypothetical protein [Thermaurantiacus sp.]
MAWDSAICRANIAFVPALGEAVLRPILFDSTRGWVADHVRLRWRALKPARRRG